MKGLKIFETDAIILASRKVAAVSGDARRALDICRRAVEIAQREITKSSPQLRRSPGSSYVGMLHVNAAVNEMFASPMVMAIRCVCLCLSVCLCGNIGTCIMCSLC